jgi:hypothetical protein
LNQLNSKSVPSSLLFGSFLSILVIVTSVIGWSSIAIFSGAQTEVPNIKITSPNNGQNNPTGSTLTIAGISTRTNASSDKIQQSETEGNSTTMSNSTTIAPALHSNSTNNSNSSNSKNNSNKIATSESLTQSPSKSTSNYNYNNSAKPLSLSIQSSQNVVNGIGNSTITAIAYDATTGKKIENALVRIKITFTSNSTSKEIVGHNGELTFSVETKPSSKDNSNISFRTTVQASAPGYISTSKTSSTMTYFGSHQESIINNNGSGELTQNILKNVQKRLEQNGINFALGK